MPRQKRADEAGAIYHALNRGNARQPIFEKDADYEAFLRVVHEGLQKYPVELFSFTLMPNHWHFVLRPKQDGQMGRLLRWITATHTLRHHAHRHTKGYGHLYQARFKSFPVADDEHFHVVCRYVERNPLRAKLVKKAEDWRHGSLHRWNQPNEPDPRVLSPWPISRLPRWTERVNSPLTKAELDEMRICVNRGRPYGSEEWIEEVAERNDLWYTLRSIGRPRIHPKSDGEN